MPQIDQTWPERRQNLSDDALLALHGPSNDATASGVTSAGASDAWVSVNFISSVDGAVTVDGRSGGLGTPADRRVFDLLRRPSDVVVVAAGTVRTEEYGPLVLDEPAVLWRRARGMPEHPIFAIVSGSLDLDVSSRIFTEAPVRPIVVTTTAASAEKKQKLAEVADVIECGADTVDTQRMIAAFVARGLRRVHSEGGPAMFGSLLRGGVVSELCLTVSPTLVAGTSGRIATGELDEPISLTLAHSLVADDGSLLLRYLV